MNDSLATLLQTRRHFFRDCGVGVGKIALGTLLAGNALRAASANPMAPKKPHHAPKAKSIIYLFMAGGPSHLDCTPTSRSCRNSTGRRRPNRTS
jgi:hypothetical protein